MAAPIVLTLSNRAAIASSLAVGYFGYSTLGCIRKLAKARTDLREENAKLRVELDAMKQWCGKYNERAEVLEKELTDAKYATNVATTLGVLGSVCTLGAASLKYF